MGLRSHFAKYGHVVLGVNELIMQRFLVDNWKVVIVCLNDWLLDFLYLTKFLEFFDILTLDAKRLVPHLKGQVVVF